MDKLKKLQLEYAHETGKYREIVEEYDELLEKIRKDIKKLARYKVGDKIYRVYCPEYRKTDKEAGIIREITTKPYCWQSDKIGIFYIIGKITKSGKMHKNQNITYNPLSEEMIAKEKI